MNFLANERLEQMNWFSLSANPCAIHLLESNLDKVEWSVRQSKCDSLVGSQSGQDRLG
jgi:hypothetical protein